MHSFGLIAEGITDFVVLENILWGFFKDAAPEIRHLQPLRDATDDVVRFGGWVRVFEYCRSSKLLQAFQFCDYLIVQIDTDCCHETGYEVSPLDAQNHKLSPEALVEKVEERLKTVISTAIEGHYQGSVGEFWENYGHRLIFAVSVEAIECWLLPLHLEGKFQADTHNCLKKLDKKGVKLWNKQVKSYEKASNDFSKPKILMKLYPENPTLKIFVEKLLTLKTF
ncbi:MAG: hypothetical protein RLZZ628_3351 [Bacteroidota bacterium]